MPSSPSHAQAWGPSPTPVGSATTRHVRAPLSAATDSVRLTPGQSNTTLCCWIAAPPALAVSNTLSEPVRTPHARQGHTTKKLPAFTTERSVALPHAPSSKYVSRPAQKTSTSAAPSYFRPVDVAVFQTACEGDGGRGEAQR